MKRYYGAILLTSLVGLAGAAQAQSGQVDGVNIVYPIHGGTYPITDPAPGKLSSAYFAASFSVRCAHSSGAHTVFWGFDGMKLGSAEFYDQTSIQFVYKLSGGSHIFFANSDCGKVQKGEVKFALGR